MNVFSTALSGNTGRHLISKLPNIFFSQTVFLSKLIFRIIMTRLMLKVSAEANQIEKIDCFLKLSSIEQYFKSNPQYGEYKSCKARTTKKNSVLKIYFVELEGPETASNGLIVIDGKQVFPFFPFCMLIIAIHAIFVFVFLGIG